MTPKRPLFLLLHSLLFALILAVAPARAYADVTEVQDWVILQGHFYTQTNGSDGSNDLGYAVIDDEDALFWTWFENLGGVNALGYPVSQRFRHGGFVAQAFQKAILLWDEQAQGVHLMNLFDELSAAGADPFLVTHRFIPQSEPWLEDAGQPWEIVVANHLALLEDDPAIKAAYYAESKHGRDPITFNGLPMGIRDYGFVLVLRAQRRAFQHWKIDTPSAGVGEVEVVNGGDLAKELSLIPAAAQEPMAAPSPPFGYGSAVFGETLYRESGCVLCHGLLADGGIGPALVGTEFDFPAFLDAVRSPSDTMPPYGEELIGNQAVRDILAHVTSLAAGP